MIEKEYKIFNFKYAMLTYYYFKNCYSDQEFMENQA